MRYVQFVVVPALWWALGVAAGFVGIGGLSLEGGGATPAAIQCLWKVDGFLAGVTFAVAFAILAKRARASR